jgi:hypothetical protein
LISLIVISFTNMKTNIFFIALFLFFSETQYGQLWRYTYKVEVNDTLLIRDTVLGRIVITAPYSMEILQNYIAAKEYIFCRDTSQGVLFKDNISAQDNDNPYPGIKVITGGLHVYHRTRQLLYQVKKDKFQVSRYARPVEIKSAKKGRIIYKLGNDCIVTCSKKLPGFITPLIFIQGNLYGIEKIITPYRTWELISYHYEAENKLPVEYERAMTVFDSINSEAITDTLPPYPIYESRSTIVIR